MSNRPNESELVLKRGLFGQPHMLFARHQVWFVILSILDVLLTWVILKVFGGREINGAAAMVIHRYGPMGLVLFKFALVSLIIIIVENIGRLRYRTGRRMAEWAIALTSIPVCVSAAQLLYIILGLYSPPGAFPAT